MTDRDLTSAQIGEITEYVDIAAPPPEGQPTAHLIFGTNQVRPVEIVAERFHRGLAPSIIATGGVNRHNGIVEGREFRRALTERGVPDEVIRHEDRSANTWQNVEFALPFLRETLDAGLVITVVGKWYHRRAVETVKTLLPQAGAFYAITWDPVYAGRPVTRTDWPDIPDGRVSRG